jgi:hypothetical protein
MKKKRIREKSLHKLSNRAGNHHLFYTSCRIDYMTGKMKGKGKFSPVDAHIHASKGKQ